MGPSARQRTRNNRQRGKNAAAKLALIGAALVAAAVAAFVVWSTAANAPSSTGATITRYEGADRQAIQEELDRRVKASMMTVAVSPTCTLETDGTLSLRVVNDAENTVAQSFTVRQGGKILLESERIDPGEEISSCRIPAIQPGDAIVTVQGLDLETGAPSGSPSSVEVSIVQSSGGATPSPS